jgi:hypothetical protein
MKATLMFYGLPEDIADMVINNKLSDDMLNKIKNIHNYNVTFLIGDDGKDKEFIIGKIMQLYLKNGKKVLLTSLINLISYEITENPILDNAKIIVVYGISTTDQKQLAFLKTLPFLYKTKSFVISLDNTPISNTIFEELNKSYMFLKVNIVEVI